MSQLIRLVYASRSTFSPSGRHQGLDAGVARILAKSRKNNGNQQIVGGLLFGDGCFLQCLEGEMKTVETLYAKIESDDRHRDVKVLSRHEIGQRSFGAWSMKYAGDQVLTALLKDWNVTRFDPYRLTSRQIEAAVDLMRDRSDDANTLPGEFDASPQSKQVESKSDRIVGTLKPTSAATTASKGSIGGRLWMVGVSILALAAGAAVFWRFG